MNCQEIKQAEQLLIKGQQCINNNEFEDASDLFSKGIQIIGDSYFSDNIKDSTDFKLILAEAEEKKGNIETAANLKRNTLDTRIALAKQKYLCE